MRNGLLVSVEAVEQYFQPELKKRQCIKCNSKFESVAAMIRVEHSFGIGWCDRCVLKVWLVLFND